MRTPPPSPLPRRAALLAGLGLLGGCAGPRPIALPTPPRGRVVLLRGLANIFSTGLDTLTRELRRAGYDATAHNHIDADALVVEIVAAVNAGTLVRPLALIGHSFGADAAIEMGGALGTANVPVDLLVSIDPRGVREVPPGPRQVVNFYQERDPVSGPLTPEPGFDGRLENRLVQGESHLSIDKSAALHAEVLALLAALRPPPPSGPAARARRPRRPTPERLPLPPRPPVRAAR